MGLGTSLNGGARAELRGSARIERGGRGRAWGWASTEHGDGDSSDNGMGRVPSVVDGYGSEREHRDSAEHGGGYSTAHRRAPLKQAVVGPRQVPGHRTFRMACVPFSPNDLVLGQQQVPRLRDVPVPAGKGLHFSRPPACVTRGGQIKTQT